MSSRAYSQSTPNLLDNGYTSEPYGKADINNYQIDRHSQDDLHSPGLDHMSTSSPKESPKSMSKNHYEDTVIPGGPLDTHVYKIQRPTGVSKVYQPEKLSQSTGKNLLICYMGNFELFQRKALYKYLLLLLIVDIGFM